MTDPFEAYEKEIADLRLQVDQWRGVSAGKQMEVNEVRRINQDLSSLASRLRKEIAQLKEGINATKAAD